MKNYFKKFSIMFVMSLILVLGCCTSAFAEEIDSNTEILMHMDDSTFYDECGNSVANKGVTLDTTSKVFGNGSAKFDSGEDKAYLSIQNSDAFNFGTGDFTIDFWIKHNSKLTGGGIFGNRTVGNFQIHYGYPHAGYYLLLDDVTLVGYENTPPMNVWQHYEFSRNGDVFRFFIDGNLVDSETHTGVTISKTSYTNWKIGWADYGASLKGNIDEFRISKGIARHTHNFTPSTEPYGNKTESNILLDKSFLDLRLNNSEQLTATTTPSAVGVTWKSSDSTIATVDLTGKVTGIKEGQATITAQIKGSETKATCVVTVTKEGTNPPVDPTNPTEPTTGDANLFIELVDGQIKNYNVSSDEIAKFKQWYLDRDNTKSNKPYYEFSKGSYKDYVIHDKIDWFEVR